MSLGKRPSSAIASCSSSPSSPSTPAHKRPRTSTTTTTLPLIDGKENIPPTPERSPDSLGRTPRAGLPRETPTSPRSSPSIRRHATFSGLPAIVASRESELVTPPDTPTQRRTTSSQTDDAFDGPLPAPKFTSHQTPSRAMKSLSLDTPAKPSATSLHSRVRAALRNASDASGVIGREMERTTIRSFVETLVAPPEGITSVDTSIYISGSPGTGKTALISSILTSLDQQALSSVYVNCMGLKDTAILWDRVLSELGRTATRKGKASDPSLRRFETLLAGRSFKCILVLDEIDTFPPASLSTIFALAKRYPKAIRIIAISNDLTQSTASRTLAVHHPSTTLVFSAYTAPEMQAIIRARLVQAIDCESEEEQTKALASIIQPPALTFMVKRVAVQTGDIRLALEVFRRALDVVTTQAGPNGKVAPIGMKDVLEALKRSAPKAKDGAPSTTPSSGRGPLESVVEALSLQARLVLLSVLIARRRAAAGLSLEDLSLLPTTFSPPTSAPSTPKKPKARTASPVTSSSDGTMLSPSKIYSFYCLALQAPGASQFEPVSRTEFTDLLGVLETSSLLAIPVAGPSIMASPSKRRMGRSKSLSSLGSTSSGTSDVELRVREEDVLRALGVGADLPTQRSVREQAIAKMWEREANRIDKTVVKRGEAAKAAMERIPEEELLL